MFIFPAHRFNPDPVKVGVMERVVTGSESIAGDEDVVSTDGGGRWQITFAGIDLDTPEMQRLWRMWDGHMAGGAQPVLVPLLTLATAPRPFAGRGEATPSDILADDADFPESVSFAAPSIVATIAADAALRATTVQIEVTQGAQIRGGEVFSVGERAHEIVRVTARDGAKATCLIRPPLRTAVEEGDPVNFDWPMVRCRAVVDQDMIPEMSGPYGTVAISFAEDFSDAG